MKKATWKVDDQDQAVYIDLEDESREEEVEYSLWNLLPDLILEKVFQYLSMRERYYCSLVCRNWNQAFYLSRVWATFVLEDETLTRRKFNYYMGWQYVLDHLRTQMCLFRVGHNFRELVFEPTYNFFNLYEFMNMLSYFAENYKKSINRVDTLRFTFSCNMATREENLIYGTGGRLLEALKRLMGNLPQLRRLELIDLMLEPKEACHLLDEVCDVCCETLQCLVLVNTTKLPYQMFHAGVFLNLQILIISPQSLGEDLIQLIGDTKLRHLHIVQNRYTEEARPVAGKMWRLCRASNRKLRVHLTSEGPHAREIIWQDFAPVNSILYNSAHKQITSESVLTAIELYKTDLEVYAHYGLPRFHMVKCFHDRIDSLMLLLCRQCPYITTLMIREKVSSATVLLIAWTAKNLRYFHVRRNAIVLRADWPCSPDWSTDFYHWLCTSSRSYESIEKEVSQILGYPWRTLTDKQYKLTKIKFHVDS